MPRQGKQCTGKQACPCNGCVGAFDWNAAAEANRRAETPVTKSIGVARPASSWEYKTLKSAEYMK